MDDMSHGENKTVFGNLDAVMVERNVFRGPRSQVPEEGSDVGGPRWRIGWGGLPPDSENLHREQRR